MTTKKPTSIDEYIADFPKETQDLLETIRKTIKNAVPEANETISYGMPAFKIDSISVWFAAYKKHIGLYPMYEMESFEDEIKPYKGKDTKDTLQFPYHKPLPLDLIAELVKYKFYKIITMDESTPNLNEKVTNFLNELNHPLRDEIEQLRNCILTANTKLAENIKWNGPNYCFDNKDRITMRIQPITTKKIQIIFHCGAKAQAQPKENLIQQHFDILTWKTNDRAIATFKNMQDIENGKTDLIKIINEWIKVTR